MTHSIFMSFEIQHRAVNKERYDYKVPFFPQGTFEKTNDDEWIY